MPGGDAFWHRLSSGGGGAAALIPAKARRTAGNVTMNSTTWANVDTALDLVLSAAAGDEIAYGLSAVVNPENVVAQFNVATVVSGNPVNTVAGRGPESTFPGVTGWYCRAGVVAQLSGVAPIYTVQAGDLSAGTVTLRLRYRTDSAINRILNAVAAFPLDVWAVNLTP